MTFGGTLFDAARSFKTRIARLLGDRRGVAAIEFAFIAPVLLALYFVTMEVSQGIETNKKVGRVASMVADLITQQQTITDEEVDAIMKIGGSILQPYDRSTPTIVVTGIRITDDTTPKVLVEWSRQMVNGAFSAAVTPGSPTTIPEKLKIENTFLVRVEAQLDYQPVITWTASEKESLGLAAAFDDIGMRETYYLRPRMSRDVLCDGC